MKSTNKLKNYLESYTREKYFTDRVAQIRKDIGIPKNGIKFPGVSFFENPDNFIGLNLSIKYQDVNYPVFGARTAIYNELLTPLPEVFKEPTLILFFNIYILYNERRYEALELFFNGGRDTVSFIKYRIDYIEDKDCDCELRVCEKYMDFWSKKYPIMIGISPYATQNEAIDLIKKRWSDIQDHMTELAKDGNIEQFEKEKMQLSRIRKRELKSKELEDLVYANKDLNIEELRTLVREKTARILDPGEIGKIKSLAIRRREGK